jgi:hypothetical protein
MKPSDASTRSKATLLEDHPSEEGDGNFDYELVVACAAKRMQLKLTSGYEAWYVSPWPGPDHWSRSYTNMFSRRVKGKFLDAKKVPYLSRFDNEENVVVLFEGTRSWLKARRKKWRTDAGVQDSVDYKACFERLAALSPEVAMRVLNKGDFNAIREDFEGSSTGAEVAAPEPEEETASRRLELEYGTTTTTERKPLRIKKRLGTPPSTGRFSSSLRFEDKE